MYRVPQPWLIPYFVFYVVSLDFLEQQYRLDMPRLREHVENPGPLQPVALPDQLGSIARQSRRVAGHIDQAPGAQSVNLLDHLERAVTRRVEQYRGEAAGGPGGAGQRLRQVGLEKVQITQTVGRGIFPRPRHHGLHAFHRHHFADPLRQLRWALGEVQRWDFNAIGQLQLWPASGKPIRLWAE